MMYPLVCELAADGIPVTVSCRVLDLARQPYYRWLDEPVSATELDEAYLTNVVFDVHPDDPEFGYRFLADEACLAGIRCVTARCGGSAHEWLVVQLWQAQEPKEVQAGRCGTR